MGLEPSPVEISIYLLLNLYQDTTQDPRLSYMEITPQDRQRESNPFSIYQASTALNEKPISSGD